MYLLKIRQKSNIPANAGHILRPEIDSTDFKNEHSTTNTTYKNHIFLEKNIAKDIETDKTIKQNKK